MSVSQNRRKVLSLAVTGVMAALAVVLLVLVPEIPIIPGLPHLKIGFSGIPSLITAFVCGPLYGVAVVLITSVIQLFTTQSPSFGIGEFLNFARGATLILVMWFVSRAAAGREGKHPVRGYYIAAAASVPAFIAAGLLLNLALLPLFFKLMGQEMTTELWWGFAAGTVPLNIIKPAVTTLPLYPVILLVKRIIPR
jgi:riboflavin transporter FmnP